VRNMSPGNPTARAGVTHDVWEDARAEKTRQLIAANARLRALLERARDFVERDAERVRRTYPTTTKLGQDTLLAEIDAELRREE